MATTTMTLVRRKETKGTVVYGTDEDVPVPSVYIKKAHLPPTHPEVIKLTIEWQES